MLSPTSKNLVQDPINAPFSPSKSMKNLNELPSPKDELRRLISERTEDIFDNGEEEESKNRYINVKDKAPVQKFVDNCIEKGIMPSKH